MLHLGCFTPGHPLLWVSGGYCPQNRAAWGWRSLGLVALRGLGAARPPFPILTSRGMRPWYQAWLRRSVLLSFSSSSSSL